MLLLPDIPTATPFEAEVTSPLNDNVILPAPVAVHVVWNVLLVSIASSVAFALLIEQLPTGPLAFTCTFQAAAEETYTVTVNVSSTYTLPLFTDKFAEAARAFE